jgi:hypothetical protein
MFRPLFPVHQTPGKVDGDVTDEGNGATSPASADATATAGRIVAA